YAAEPVLRAIGLSVPSGDSARGADEAMRGSVPRRRSSARQISAKVPSPELRLRENEALRRTEVTALGRAGILGGLCLARVHGLREVRRPQVPRRSEE